MSTLLIALATLTLSHAEERSFNVTAVEINKTRFWFPSTLVVKKGDHVKIKAVSKVPGDAASQVHGYAIDDFKVQEVVDAKGKEISFTADKSGVFTIRCHMHPAHVGGQLVVLD
jgi:nitrosocyanin